MQKLHDSFRFSLRRSSLFVALLSIFLSFQAHGQSLLLNPSFESNFNDTFPHYGSIDDWIGGSGVNKAAGPFHNRGTPIPDQLQVAFMQGSSKLSQEIVGFQPGKQYWIQFFFDARNCCGGTIDLITRFNDKDLDKVTNVKPASGGAPFYFRNVPFTPEEDFGTIAFATAASGDATIVLDAVTVVQRDAGDLAVMNPSFEASGLPFLSFDGLISPDGIAGWIGEGSYGVNQAGLGPYANNGAVPDQDFVAFVQDVGSIKQRLANLVVGSSYQLSFAYNARTGNSPRLEVKAGDVVLLTEDVSPVGGGNPYRTKTLSFTANDTFMSISFAQTKAGDQTLLLDNVRVAGQTQEALPPLEFAPTAAELAPGQKTSITVTLPQRILEIKAVDIKLRSPNPASVRLANADAEGVLTLHFNQGGSNTRAFEVEAVARGVVRIEVLESANLEIANDVAVNVSTSLVRNSSFESSPRPGGVGYGAILAWEGGSGINKSDGPFQDNSVIPDRDQVAFLQGRKTLSQEIGGLKSGKIYWLQFRYNVRNCCAGGTLDLAVRFNGKDLLTLPRIIAAELAGAESYYFQNIEFVPESSSGLLEFSTSPNGDATLLLDAVSIVEREMGEVVIQNPSFEAAGNPVGVGYLQPRNMAGWEMTGGFGVNITGVGPFADNGTAIDQDKVLFMQGSGSATQLITGFTPNRDYTLIYYANARNCCGAGVTRYSVSFDGEVLLEEDIVAVGGNNPYELRFMVIHPLAEEGILSFATSPEGDHTFLLDNIRIVPGVVTPPPPPPPSVPLTIARRENNTSLRISWPRTARTFFLQSSTGLPGGWAELFDPIEVDGNENFVIVNPGAEPRYFRLSSE
ncbi:MAG: DUF642 domain-containing protein [Verrucomicrobia bacterium]|nr:DUF642 domain-containing protein [Verrucomicrobiota bacterium]